MQALVCFAATNSHASTGQFGQQNHAQDVLEKTCAIKTGQWPPNLKSINYNWLQLVDLLEKLQLFVLRTNRRWWYPGLRVKPFTKSEKGCTHRMVYVYRLICTVPNQNTEKKCTCQNVKQIFSGRWLVMSQDSYPSGSPIFTMTPLPLN